MTHNPHTPGDATMVHWLSGGGEMGQLIAAMDWSQRPYDAAQQIMLTVVDPGPGIPPALQARIFEPFFTSKPLGLGSGLGLPLCRGMVAVHGGTLDVTSALGHGATFRLTLPVGPATQAFLEASGAPCLLKPFAITRPAVSSSAPCRGRPRPPLARTRREARPRSICSCHTPLLLEPSPAM
jgi:hypothetical protein